VLSPFRKSVTTKINASLERINVKIICP